MRASIVLCLALGAVAMSSGSVIVSRTSGVEILTQPGASAPERLAARELAEALSKIVSIRITPKDSDRAARNAILVGNGPLTKRHFPEVDLSNFGAEEIVIKAKGDKLLVAGGRPRGTVYAVNRLLHRIGVRWWTPWASSYPQESVLEIKNLDIREKPHFESRTPFWFHAFDRDWARRNNSNAAAARLTDEDGGKIVYQGFVHTFYPLVPPDEHFKDHPEWYSLLGGVRKVEGGQLCTTNPQLRDFIVDRVRGWLRENPSASIVSVSQNDWYGPCECPNCQAIDEPEGSHAATVLALANYIAEKIEIEFPHVAVDTLAYQYTRKAPKTLKPRHNVIVRLCSIECNFAQPLTHASNASFADDIRDWSRLTNRLYVWNYVTDFANYMMPFPNWRVIGPNQRFFAENGVKGLFEQGAYQSTGASMAEMEAWVQAQLLWDPKQDANKLIAEFLNGYYGKASKPIQRYLDLLANRAASHPLTIFMGPDQPFFDAETVLKSDELWAEAERLVPDEPDLKWRVRLGRLPIRFVILNRWNGLRSEANRNKIPWSPGPSRKAVADDWIAVAKGPGPEGWTAITHMTEGGLTPESWIQRFAVDPEPVVLPERAARTLLPPDLVIPTGAEVVDAQDDEATLFGEGDMVEIRPDPAASDGIACRMPGSHHEWAFQVPVKKLPKKLLKGIWNVYAVVRVEEGADPAATAFTAGIYRSDDRKSLGSIQIGSSQTGGGYRSYPLGSTELNSSCYVWVAPPGGSSKAVWVDRILFVRQ